MGFIASQRGRFRHGLRLGAVGQARFAPRRSVALHRRQRQSARGRETQSRRELQRPLRAGDDRRRAAPEASQDFGYSLGVLHHIPDTQAAMTACARLLKPGAPFLVYLYYRFDNRPAWFRWVWRTSEIMRAGVSGLPARLKSLVTDVIALTIYWPLARLSWLGEQLGFNMRHCRCTAIATSVSIRCAPTPAIDLAPHWNSASRATRFVR